MMRSLDLNVLTDGRARLWHFSCSHDRLAVRVQYPEPRQPQYLVLSGCEEISAPVFWVIKHPEIKNANDEFIEFTDENVRIVCQDAVLEDSYKAL